MSDATEFLYPAVAGGVGAFLSTPGRKQYLASVTALGPQPDRMGWDLLVAAAGTVGLAHVPRDLQGGVRLAAAYGVGDLVSTFLTNRATTSGSTATTSGTPSSTGYPVLDYSVVAAAPPAGSTRALPGGEGRGAPPPGVSLYDFES